jgi:hypothetical protein
MAIFDITQPLSPKQVAARDGLNVTDLLSPPDVGGRCMVALLATGPAQLFELAVDGTLNSRATYPQVLWFAGPLGWAACWCDWRQEIPRFR